MPLTIDQNTLSFNRAHFLPPVDVIVSSCPTVQRPDSRHRTAPQHFTRREGERLENPLNPYGRDESRMFTLTTTRVQGDAGLR